jgi:hypothetical protein
VSKSSEGGFAVLFQILEEMFATSQCGTDCGFVIYTFYYVKEQSLFRILSNAFISVSTEVSI